MACIYVQSLPKSLGETPPRSREMTIFNALKIILIL